MSPLVPIPSTLLDRFEAAGLRRVEPSILQPSEPFLHVMGEELRQRMFLTSDAEGRELCLRPDFTIPVARAHLAGPDAAAARAYFYAGPIFRQRRSGPSETPQAGVESFGRADSLACETEMLALALEACATLGVAEPHIQLGDLGLIAAAVEAVDAPDALKRRLTREIAYGGATLDALADPGPAPQELEGLFAALDAAGPKAARAVIEDVLSLAGIAAVGGRTPAEIADRFIEQNAARSAGALDDEARRALNAFLAIEGGAREAADRLAALASSGLGLGAAAEAFAARLDAFEAAGLPVNRMRFSARFGRRLDYYTGLVFELSQPGQAEGPLAGGGRYDRLLSALGAPSPVTGVGFSLWLDRFPGAAR
ncbi:ATP phosphoribosyltransferase regulatory subunit [Methylopila jiangsuensis]|uniref:ATP phosphoribosyltransferase regulatory subunit n=1 Tax=Methylopila jiangsuensis TaxID=586230 RepID=A0A9W6JJN9_9HYPH|nr:ATP phosphoribosyltransferase regulatory subunit [Methylopila jiangsuensis]MDR6286875.1 ATP phosphoribosyltransferase regulatory subunit [Methylopila jiangsuensis]GLK76778.1 ATP phosphoribosyltransferase regulatory subunit [Methylopila jiangsuensis]